MKAIIYFFSGTGNTKKVASLYQKYLVQESENKISEVELFSVEHLSSSEKPVPNPNDYDLAAFAYPVHGFNAPKIFYDFCKFLPSITDCKKGEKKTAFLFKTSGEGLTYNNYASQKIIRVLEKKGFSFLSERHYVMPYNMIFRHSKEMVKSEWLYAQGLAKLHSREIASGKKEEVHLNPLKAWFVPLFRIEWLYAQLQGPSMKVDMTKCIKCMKCVKSCPYDNISYNKEKNKFIFGTKCALCVRCSFGCPTCAISIGLLNNWRVNGSYNIEKTAQDPKIKFPYFKENLTGLKKWLYFKYYKKLDKEFEEKGINLLQMI